MKVIVEQVKVAADITEKEVFELARARLKKTRAFSFSNDFFVYKRSIDARKKSDIKIVYSICANVEAKRQISADELSKFGIKILCEEEITFECVGKQDKKPLIVGFGPCGMFCALCLARAGLKPVVIERGADVDTRVRAVEDFNKNRTLDLNTNIQFGAGGAGTFSDGKLTTGINDPKCSYVLKTFYELGAPKEICFSAKPHIGTDILRRIVKNIENEIISLGGEIYYNTQLLSFENGIAKTTKGEFLYKELVLAIGHSARDTYAYLLNKGVAIEPKPFSVGVRVEHLRSEIDYAMYGDMGKALNLCSASYKLSHRENNKGVYSFCMCPGGQVVAAASEEKTVVVNGMSYHARDGVNSNSAIVVQVDRGDYGSTPEKAIEFQRTLEKKAFVAAGSNYSAPVQTLGDFYNGTVKAEPKRVMPTYMDGHTTVCDINEILPKFVCDYLKLGFRKFGNSINGFDRDDIPITGVETRTSSPIRIIRNENYTMLTDSSVYPGGEGAGYAGGIMSAAVDGINIALAILKK